MEGNMDKNINIKECFSLAWNEYKKNFLPFSFWIIASGIVSLILYRLGPSFLNQFLIQVVFTILTFGIRHMAYIVMEGRSLEILSFFNYGRAVFWRAAGVYFVYTTATAIGMLFLLIPGLFIAVKWVFFPYALFDKKQSIESLSYSWQITKGYFFSSLLLEAIGVALILLGFTIAVGLVVVLPLFILAEAFFYKQLRKMERDQGMGPEVKEAVKRATMPHSNL